MGYYWDMGCNFWGMAFPFLFGLFPVSWTMWFYLVFACICSILELRSLICVLFTTFWRLDLSRA